MTTSANFDELDLHQRLTLFTFALLTQPTTVPHKEAVAEGLFEHLYEVFTTPLDVGGVQLIPLLALADDSDNDNSEGVSDESRTLEAILDAEGNVATILPHDSECVSLVISPRALLPKEGQDQNPYTILGHKFYGELHGDGLRRLLILGEIRAEAAQLFGTEPLLVFLDFDLAEEDAPRLYELPQDLAHCLGSLLGQQPGVELSQRRA